MSQPSTSDPRRVESDFRRHLRWAVVWPLAAFFLAAGVLVALVLHVQHRNKRVDQTDVVIGRATLVERLIVDRESRLRAYMVTGDRRFSESYREADERLAPAITNLEELVSEHPAQVARLVSMQAALARWQEYAEQQLARRLDAATAQDVPFHVLDGEAIASDIRSRLHEFIEVEEARRVRRGIRAEAVTHYAFLLGLVFALLLGPALALTTAYQMGRSRQKYREALEAQERTARTLRESEEKLRLAEDAAKMGSLHRDFLSGETVWSDSFKALFDLSPDAEMSYEVFLAAVHPDDRDRVDRAVQDALANRTPYQVEMRVPWPDGSVRWVASRGEAFYDDHGRPVRMAGMALDVTAQKRAEEAVRESDRRKDEFLGMLSHELRNPLASIHNSVHLLGHAAPASEQAARARTVIERQVDHLARLVDDLLDVKRISTGKLRLRTAVMDLTQQVRETVEDIRPLFVSRSLSLDMKAPDQAVRVDGDRTRLTQMVSNLLHNAAKFTDAGGHVSVTVESRGGQGFGAELFGDEALERADCNWRIDLAAPACVFARRPTGATANRGDRIRGTRDPVCFIEAALGDELHVAARVGFHGARVEARHVLAKPPEVAWHSLYQALRHPAAPAISCRTTGRMRRVRESRNLRTRRSKPAYRHSAHSLYRRS